LAVTLTHQHFCPISQEQQGWCPWITWINRFRTGMSFFKTFVNACCKLRITWRLLMTRTTAR
jgi:hypothetical protein